MRRILCIVQMTAVAMLICVSDCGAASKHVIPGSFLAAKVNSANDLAAHVANNKLVATRYAQHYGTTPENIAKYFQTNIKLISLGKPLKTTTYFVRKRDGRITSRKSHYPAGTRMFATLDGTPIMELGCGNPITRRLPDPPKPAPQKMTAIPQMVEPETKVAAAEPLILAPPTGTLPPPLEVPVVPAVVPAVAPVSAPPVAAAPVGKWVVPALLGAVTVRSSSSPPPVPEPATILTAVGILAPVAFVFKRRKNRS